MAIRIIMILALALAFTGCLKKAADETISLEPGAEQAAMLGAVQPADTQSVNVSVEQAIQTEVVEKPSVQDIQQALKNADLYDGKVDGISGPKTKKAVESFQSQNGLKPDGKVGPKTWQKLKEYLAK